MDSKEIRVSLFLLPPIFQKYLIRLFLDQVDSIDRFKLICQTTREDARFSEFTLEIKH
jgi:hypothetical protein